MAWLSGYGGKVVVTAGSATGWNAGVTDWRLQNTVRLHETPYIGGSLTSGLAPPVSNGIVRWRAVVNFLFDTALGQDDLWVGDWNEITIRLYVLYSSKFFVGVGILEAYNFSAPIDRPITGVATIRGVDDTHGWTASS